jgi:hypothetical protein
MFIMYEGPIACFEHNLRGIELPELASGFEYAQRSQHLHGEIACPVKICRASLLQPVAEIEDSGRVDVPPLCGPVRIVFDQKDQAGDRLAFRR